MDITTLSLAKKYANKIAAGITAARVEGSSIILTLVDGTEAICQLPAPKDGISVIDLSIDTDGSLLCHMSDGTTIDAGYVPTIDPDLTNYYTKEEIDKELKDHEYKLPIASADTLGGIKIGENLSIDENGVVSASGGGDSDSIPIFRLYISSQMATYMFGVGITLSPNEKSQLQNILDKKLDNYLIEVNFYNSSLQKSTFLFQLYGKHRDKIVFNTVETIYFNNTPTLCDIRLTINGEFTDETNTCSSAVLKYYNTLYQIPLKTDVLVKTNTSSYTPTSDYNPATKKYVDDAITTAITDALGGNY